MYSIWHVWNRTALIYSSMEWYSCVFRYYDSLFWGWLNSIFLMRNNLEELSGKIHEIRKQHHVLTMAGGSIPPVLIVGWSLAFLGYCILFQACSTNRLWNKLNFKELVILLMFFSLLDPHSSLEYIQNYFNFSF